MLNKLEHESESRRIFKDAMTKYGADCQNGITISWFIFYVNESYLTKFIEQYGKYFGDYYLKKVQFTDGYKYRLIIKDYLDMPDIEFLVTKEQYLLNICAEFEGEYDSWVIEFKGSQMQEHLWQTEAGNILKMMLNNEDS